jgi:hypothetical protein
MGITTLTPSRIKGFACLYILHLLLFVVLLRIYVSPCIASYILYYVYGTGNLGYIRYKFSD